MTSTRTRARAVLVTAALAAAFAVASPAIAFDPTFDFEVKGQVYSETTNFGTGVDRTGSRTDIHFQRLRLVVTGMLDDTYGFKFQTCGACGTSKQGFPRLRGDAAGRRRERPRRAHHRRLRDRELLREAELQDRPDEAPSHAREPGRLLCASVAGPLDVRLQRVRHFSRQVQPGPRRGRLGRLPRRQAAVFCRHLPGAGGDREDHPSLQRRHGDLLAAAQGLLRVRRPHPLRISRRRARSRVSGHLSRRPEDPHARRWCRLRA